MNIADLATKVFSGRMWKHKDVHPKALGEMQPIEGGMSVPQVTMRGNPVTLVGDEVKVGDKARDFTVVANDLSTVTLNDTSGVRIFLSVPSLDTGVCDAEVRRFNEEAASLEGVKVYTISMDLPFAQARWCGAAGVENVVTLSDHRVRLLWAKLGRPHQGASPLGPGRLCGRLQQHRNVRRIRPRGKQPPRLRKGPGCRQSGEVAAENAPKVKAAGAQ